MPTISLESVSKFFGHQRALDRLSLSIESGETLAILGANGAGKSTLLLCLAGLLRPDIGRVLYDDVQLERPFQRKWKSTANISFGNIGLLTQVSLMYDLLSVEENLMLAATLHRVVNPRIRVAELIDRLALEEVRSKRLVQCSLGTKKRAAIARTCIANPQVLLLDEPFSSLDLAGREALSGLIVEFQERGATILFSTHELEMVPRHASRVIKLNQGKLCIN